MSNIRRYYIPDSIVFITSVTQGRIKLFNDPANIKIFNETIDKVKQIHPFEIIAYIILPDHFHFLMFSEKNSHNFSQVMKSLKGNFTANYKKAHHLTTKTELWQKRFWDHIIRSEEDFENHLNYIHWNPVKHGYVDAPEKWIHSSYLHWVEQGVYELGWGTGRVPEGLDKMDFE